MPSVSEANRNQFLRSNKERLEIQEDNLRLDQRMLTLDQDAISQCAIVYAGPGDSDALLEELTGVTFDNDRSIWHAYMRAILAAGTELQREKVDAGR